MNVEAFTRACSLLSRMPSATPWCEEQAELYSVGLQTLPDNLLLDTINRAVMTCDERPTVARLVAIADSINRGVRPSVEVAWEEVQWLVNARGLYCDPDPFKPNIYREGEPAFSHPLIGQTVRQMGGWRAVCTAESGVDSLRERFKALYEDMADRMTSDPKDLLLFSPPDPKRARQRLRVAVGGR